MKNYRRKGIIVIWTIRIWRADLIYYLKIIKRRNLIKTTPQCFYKKEEKYLIKICEINIKEL